MNNRQKSDVRSQMSDVEN